MLKGDNMDTIIDTLKSIIEDFMKELNSTNDYLSKYDISISKTKTFISVKANNRMICKFQIPNTKRGYLLEYEGLKFESNDCSELLNRHKTALLARYKKLSELSDEAFGCCSSYIECSDNKKCIKSNTFSINCQYRRNLEAGRIFYGKNRNM